MNDPTETIGNGIRVLMSRLATVLNKLTRGKLRPSHITTLSLVGHLPAGWALWQGRPVLAAVLITVFGLMDALDGALAREQKSVSKLGMLYDSVSDRLKEILIYSALAVFVSRHNTDVAAWVLPAVASTSILVSFVRARGETAVAGPDRTEAQLNKMFTAGVARYEIRMFLLIVGLLTGLLAPLLNLIIALNLATASTRFMEVARFLNIEDSTSLKPKKK